MVANKLDFSELAEISRFLEGLRQGHAPTLEHYYNPVGHGFLHQINSPPKKDPSETSTATCVNSLVAASQWSRTGNMNGTPWVWESAIEKIYDASLGGPWVSGGLEDGNPYTTAFVIETVLDLEAIKPTLQGRNSKRRAEGLAILQRAIANGPVRLTNYPPSAYLTQLTFRVLDRAKLIKLKSAQKVFDWAIHEIVYQQALLASGTKSADPYQLCYAIILAADTVRPESLSPDHKAIIAKGLALFFDKQLPDGSWPRSQSLFHYPDFGSAYCYEYELLSQLIASNALRDLCLVHLRELVRAALTLEQTAFKLEFGWSWSSGDFPQVTGPESWTTAYAYLFAHRLERLLAEAIRRKLFSELGERYSEPRPHNILPDQFASGFLDCPATHPGCGDSLRDLLYNRFVVPVAAEISIVARGGRLRDETPMSTIFYGPPGTSKTELAKSVSSFLGWPLLAVDPSYFVKDGLNRIQAQANKLFQILELAEQVVVLFDEFDEMVRDRANADEALSRFLTTAMLPKLATIYKKRRLIFIVATNFITGFDSAISRAGRFDMIVQIMPPTVQAKVKKWRELSKLQSPDNSERLADLTFLECQMLVRQISQSPAHAHEILKSIHKDCTLSSPNPMLATSLPQERHERVGVPNSWKETSSHEAAHYFRIPPAVR